LHTGVLRIESKSQNGWNELYRTGKITGCQIRQRLSPEQIDCIRKLFYMGNNLNQIAKRANAGGCINASSEYLHLVDKIDQVINLLEDDSENS
jgi:hypothetical protein